MVRVPEFEIAAPPVVEYPSVILNPEMSTVAPELTAMTLLLPLPEIVSSPAPGPAMETSLPIPGNALASVIVPVRPDWKAILSPLAATVMASRNEQIVLLQMPSFESFSVLTVQVVCAEAATASKHDRVDRMRRRIVKQDRRRLRRAATEDKSAGQLAGLVIRSR